MSDQAVKPMRKGVAIVANDKIFNWVLPFLESFRETNRDLPLYLIPYDENVSLTRQAAEIYGAVFVQDDLSEIDLLARRLYPLAPYRRRRLRKLQSLALPLDRVIYMDVDTLLFRDLSGLFDLAEPGEADFVIASLSAKYVYNWRHRRYDFLQKVPLFSDGFFLTSPSVLSLKNVHDVIDRDIAIFHAVRKRGGLYAQPLVNFVVHRLALEIRSLSQRLPTASDESYYKAEQVSFRDGNPVDYAGRDIYFVHWAGALRTPRGRIFDQTWQKHAERAAARMKL